MNGIFVGSFNPITNAHLDIAHCILKELKLDKIIFVPASNLYQKESLNASEKDRYTMIELAIENEVNFEVDDFEIQFAKTFKRQAKTIETMKHFDKNSILIIGSDNFSNLKNWYRVDDLLDEYNIVVYPRQGFEIDVNDKIYLKYSKKIIILKNKVKINISSTKARENIRNNENSNNLLPQAVLMYIKEHNLYGIQ